MSSNASTASRRAARIKQIREKQHRAITPRGGSASGGTGSSIADAAPSSALSADDNVGSDGNGGGSDGGGVVVDDGSPMLSPSSSSGGNGGGGGDASSVASSRSRTRGQRAAAYRARKAAKAAASSSSSKAAAATASSTATNHHHHPPVHPPTAGGSGSNGTSSSSSRRAPSPSPQMQIDSVMSSASDVMSTTSHHTTSSQMTAKAANTPQRRGRGNASTSTRTRTRSASPAPRSSASSRRSACPSPSPARPSGSGSAGGSRSANLRKLRSENPSLLPTGASATSATAGSSGRSRSHSVSSNRSGRSRSVEPSGRYGQQEAPPTPPTPVDTVQVAHEEPGSSDPTSDIESCGVASPSSPMSASSSKSEHLSVEKGIRLIQNMDTSVRNASPSPRSTAKGRAPSPFRRHNNDAPSAARSSSPGPSSRPDPPRESPTPSRKTAWDRAQKAVEAQMDSQEVERAPPMEPEEVKEVPPPSPRQPPTPTKTSRHQPEGSAADAMLLSPEQEEARLKAEEEIRHLEARASVMKQQMERQAEILVRQEEEMVQPTDPTAVYGQEYLPPNVPPTPQFSQFDYNDPTAPPPPQPSFQQPSVPAPTLPNNPYPHTVAPAAGMNAPVPPYHSSSPSTSYAPAPTNSSPMVHPQHAPAYHHQQQVYNMEQQQQQYPAPMPQDSGMYYQNQPPHLQVDPIESFRAQEQQSKYREYTLSPSNQQGAPNGLSPYRPPPQAQYYHQQGSTYPSAQQGGVGFTAEPIVSHMHHQSHSETYTYEQTNPNTGMQYNQQQQQRETIQSMAVNPNMQQQAGYYYGNAGPREGSEANMSEPSFDPSSISHLTQSTFASHSHPHEQPHQQPQEEPLRATRDPPANSGTPGQQAPSPRPVAPVLSPDAFKSAGTNGFGSDSDSDFDNPTFSPQSADNKSNDGSKTISEAEKSGTSWWKDPFSEESPGPHGSHKPKQLQSVAESHLDGAGFPVSETVPPPSSTANQPPAVKKSMMPPSPVHHPVRSPSPAMNSVTSGQASHFTAASAATADSLGRRLAAKLNINPDDDEDVFSGLEDGTVLPSANDKPSQKPLAVTRGELPNEDIFDGVASPVASPTASRPDASKASLGEAQSPAMASNTVTSFESKGTAGLNTVEGPKALMDDATSFAGSASLIASKRSAANTSGQNAHSLNLEYSASTRDKGAAANKENVVDAAAAAALNEPATAGVLGMEKEGLNEPNAAGVLGLDNGSTKQNQFVMGGEDNQNILEFEDAGTVTSDITSSIIDTGPTARKEAYEAYAAAATTPSAKYEPILEGDAESKSKGSNDEYEDEDTFDPDVNTIDNTVDDTYDNTLDHTLDTAESRRHGDRKGRRKGNDEKGRKSRRHYDSDSYSEGTDTYDDITRGGSTVMTSASGTSSGSRHLDFFSRFGCGVLDSIATQCAGHGPRPHSFDDRSLEDGDLYNEEEGGRKGRGGQSFDRTLDNSTLNGTLGTDTVTDTDNGGLSRKEQRLWDAWDKKDSAAALADTTSNSVASKSIGTATHLEELEQRQQRAQHLERRARAQEQLLLNSYGGAAAAAGMEKVEENAASITPTSNTSSNAENKQPGQTFNNFEMQHEGDPMPSSTSPRPSSATGSRDALQPSPLKPESPLQIKPKPPSAPTGSKMLAAKSAIMQRQTLEKFCIRLKNQGMDVLKMNRDKKWQDRVLTVSKEVTYLSQGKNSIFSGDRGHCPQGLLWAKKFNTKTREHSVSDIDKTGKGGMLLSNLQGASLGNVTDYPLSKKQLQGEFKDSVVVVLHTAEDGYPGNLRDVVLRCKSMDDATFICSGCKAIADTLQRDAEAKILASQRGNSNGQVLSPRSPANDPLWEM